MRSFVVAAFLALLQVSSCRFVDTKSGYNITGSLKCKKSLSVLGDLKVTGHFLHNAPPIVCTASTQGAMRWNGRNYEVCYGAWQPLSFCDVSFPDASQVLCLDAVENSCNEKSSSYGTALHPVQCLLNARRTACGQDVVDDCGNACGILGSAECDGSAAGPLEGLDTRITGPAVLAGSAQFGATHDNTIAIEATILGTGLRFEGAIIDSTATSFAFTPPSQDRYLVWPDSSGTVLTTGNLLDAAGELASVSVSGDMSVGDIDVVQDVTLGPAQMFGPLGGRNPIVFEGNEAFDGAKTMLIVNPTRPNSIALPDVSGTILTTGNAELLASSLTDFSSASSTSLTASGNCVLGAIGTSTTLAGSVTSVANFANNVTLGGSPSDTIALNSPVRAEAMAVQGSAAFGGDAVLGGRLSVTGTVQGQEAIAFEGITSDAYTTQLLVQDPTSPRTISIPDATGMAITTASVTQAITSATPLGGVAVAGNCDVAGDVALGGRVVLNGVIQNHYLSFVSNTSGHTAMLNLEEPTATHTFYFPDASASVLLAPTPTQDFTAVSGNVLVNPFAPPAAGDGTTLSGGSSSVVSGPYATVTGGLGQTSAGAAAAVLGGSANSISGADRSVIAGGNGNSVVGPADSASVVAGYSTSATGGHSVAMGPGAQASGGSMVVNANSAGVAGAFANEFSSEFAVSAYGGVQLITHSNATARVGATLPPGSGSWASLSDRYSKTGFKSVDVHQVLHSVTGGALPVSTWAYRSSGGASGNHSSSSSANNTQQQQEAEAAAAAAAAAAAEEEQQQEAEGAAAAAAAAEEEQQQGQQQQQQRTQQQQQSRPRHMGPIAQDFHAAFGLGSGDRHITTVDADGVVLAAVQATAERAAAQQARLDALAGQAAANAALLRSLLGGT